MRLALGLGLPYGGEAGVGVPGGSPASKALIDETDGLALSFVDDYFLSSTGHYGSARVKYTSTPANNYNSHPFGLLTYSGASPKLCRGPDGNLRYGAHNLCAPSEDFTAWSKSNANVTADQALAPDGTLTADLVEFTANVGNFAQINRSVSVAAGYSINYSIYIMAADEDNIGKTVTIDGNAFSGGSQSITLTGSWQKVNKVLVSQGGSTQVRVISYPAQTATRFYVWSAHVRRVPSDDTYLKTTDAAVYELPYEWDENGNLLGIRVEEQRTNLFLNSRSPATQDISVTAQAYTLSFYGTGKITLSGAHSDELQGTGEDERVTLTFTPSAGTLTCTVSGTIDWVQLEAGAFATSPIVTAGSTVTRAADNITLATSAFPYNATQGSMKSRSTAYTHNSAAANIVDSANAGNNRIAQYIGSNYFGLIVSVSGANQCVIAPAITNDTTTFHSVASRFAENDFAHCLDGGSVGTDTTGSMPTVDQLWIGRQSANYANSHIKEIIYLPRRMSNTELQTLTGA